MMVFHETSSSLLYHAFRVFLYLQSMSEQSCLILSRPAYTVAHPVEFLSLPI